MGGQRRRHVAATIAAILAVLIASGCQDTATTPSASPSPPPDRIPADFDVTFRWIPGAVFDVSGQEGTFVRAFVESFELANAGRSVGWGYRGFAHAAPSNIAQMIAAYPPEQSAANPGVGTAFFTGLRRVDDGDWTRIILCRHGYRSIKVSDREWSSRVDRPRPIEIDFRRSHTALPTNTRGTARTPRGDVFGDWYATRYDFSAIYPRTTADEHACAAAAPSEVPARAPEIGPRPWPSLPPSPGWQATSPL